ncbi:MAG: glycosyltransferase [Nitrospirota bacterium]
MHIVVITSNYPSKSLPSYGTFVRQLVLGMARIGAKCSVISPASVFQRRYGKFDPEISIDNSAQGNPVTVFRPRYLSYSSRQLLCYNTGRMTQKSFERAALRTLLQIKVPPSVLYGHFLYPGGGTAVRLAKGLGIPSCVAVGESSLWTLEPMGFDRARRDFREVSKIVAVSTALRRSLTDRLGIPEEKITVLPNGTDLGQFYPRNRGNLRKRLGFSEKKFIIAFVGHFDERKGPHRLLTAVSGMEDIGLLFIGKGPALLEGKNILFKGVLDHVRVPDMLSAADIFVLPTLAEGSCNAIVEAMACGLPVVSSRGDFNEDILDDDVSLRVDPLNIGEIRKAIVTLRDNRKLREVMSRKAAEKAKVFDINVRAQRIVDWITGVGGKTELTRAQFGKYQESDIAKGNGV